MCKSKCYVCSSVNITTAIVDSEGIPHNVVQTIDITQDRQYPAVKETLPTLLAGAVFAGVALFCWLFTQVFLRCLVSRKWDVVHDVHNTALGVLESASLELFFADVLKPFAGRYRPRYLAIAAAANAASNSHAEWEGRVSYPSGHSGTAFSILFFFTLYLLGKTRAYSSTGRFGGGSAGRFGAVVFASLPTLSAFLIAITRTRDYMHNFSDINAGAIIGITTATLAYFNVFPALTDPNCHLPRVRLQKENVARSDSEEMTSVAVNKETDVDRNVSTKNK